MKVALVLTGLMIVAAGCWFMLSGCESTSTPDSVMTVVPAAVDLDMSNRLAVFTAAIGSNTTTILPLVWSVSIPSLGSITNSVGLTAIYQSSGGTGVNSVIVRDQLDHEGIAVVNQK